MISLEKKTYIPLLILTFKKAFSYISKIVFHAVFVGWMGHLEQWLHNFTMMMMMKHSMWWLL
jgi:hypothetical protein